MGSEQWDMKLEACCLLFLLYFSQVEQLEGKASPDPYAVHVHLLLPDGDEMHETKHKDHSQKENEQLATDRVKPETEKGVTDGIQPESEKVVTDEADKDAEILETDDDQKGNGVITYHLTPGLDTPYTYPIVKPLEKNQENGAGGVHKENGTEVIGSDYAMKNVVESKADKESADQDKTEEETDNQTTKKEEQEIKDQK